MLLASAPCTRWAPFLFERRCRLQCLRLTAFGVSHALNTAQQDLMECKYGRLKRDADRRPRALLATMPRHPVPAPSTVGAAGALNQRDGQGADVDLHGARGLVSEAALVQFVSVAAAHGLRASPLDAGGHTRGGALRGASRVWPPGFTWSAKVFRELPPFLLEVSLEA